MKIIKNTDSLYPKRLLTIKNAPKQLYVKGNETLLNKQAIAIVGTRMPSEYGIKVVTEFAKELSNQNYCVISGLAQGIDTYAHMGAKCGKGKTVAVLGAGFNHIYPKQNTKLYQDIIEEGGCIVSEYDPNEEVKPENFPKRNRIISGLAMGVLIIEARYRSGSSITVKFAIEQNKEIFCVPGNIDKPTSYIPNEYIKNGAFLVTSAMDIINYYPIKKEEKNIDKDYKELYQYINEIPISSNELCKLTNLSIASVNERLIYMEIEGLIKNVAGGYIKI